MYSADDFIIYNPQRLEDLCFLVTYKSILNDLDFTFELQTRRKGEKFKHSILLPNICSTITPDFVKETVKQRLAQLKGMVSVDFRQKFLKEALNDRSYNHIQEKIFFDVCLGEDFDEFELEIPIDVSSQTRMDIVEKLLLVPCVQDLKIKVGRDYDDPSEAKAFCDGRSSSICSICIAVNRALNLASYFTYLRVFKFIGVGQQLSDSPVTLLAKFGKNCHFLEVFHMLDTKIFCEDLLYLVCKDPTRFLYGDLDETVLNQERENLWPCSATLREVRIYETMEINLRWSREKVGVFLLRNAENIQYLNLDVGEDREVRPSFTLFKMLSVHGNFLSSSTKQFGVKKLDLPMGRLSKEWANLCRTQFQNLQAVQIIGTKNFPLISPDEQLDLIPQVREVSFFIETRPSVPDSWTILDYASVFGNVETLKSDFVFEDFQVLDTLEKLKCLELSVRYCQNDERTPVQRNFVPSRTYALTKFTCPNVCLGPDVAREIVKHSPFLNHVHLQCIHGVTLQDLVLSGNLTEFHIRSYDDHFSVDAYIEFVEKYEYLKKVSFPARVLDYRARAVPKLIKLYALCTPRDVDLQFVVYSCNRFWEELDARAIELPQDSGNDDFSTSSSSSSPNSSSSSSEESFEEEDGNVF